MALCGIAAEDDDANLAQGNNSTQKSAAPAKGEVSEMQMKATYKGLPIHIKEGLEAAGIKDHIEFYQFYKAAKGDLKQLEKLIAAKMGNE